MGVYYAIKELFANGYKISDLLEIVRYVVESKEDSEETETTMSEEHLIENIICYVQSVGWTNVPEQHAEDNVPFYDAYERYGRNGQTQVTVRTFRWLLDMAKYVVYQATMGADLSEKEDVIKVFHPLGSSFIQYPFSESPNEIFKPTVWEVIGEHLGCVEWRRIK